MTEPTGLWGVRQAADGWWEVYSRRCPDFVYAKSPTEGQAKMVMWLMNGNAQVHRQ